MIRLLAVCIVDPQETVTRQLYSFCINVRSFFYRVHSSVAVTVARNVDECCRRLELCVIFTLIRLELRKPAPCFLAPRVPKRRDCTFFIMKWSFCWNEFVFVTYSTSQFSCWINAFMPQSHFQLRVRVLAPTLTPPMSSQTWSCHCPDVLCTLYVFMCTHSHDGLMVTRVHCPILI